MTKITRIQCGNGNCFCIEEDGNAILIDTSRTEFIDVILAACKGVNIRLIVLTHGHIDHSQNAAALARALGAPIAMHRSDVGLIKNNMEEQMTADSFVGKIVLSLTLKIFEQEKVEPFEPSVFIDDGDSLESYGVNAKVIGLPGHTKGSIGILVGDSNVFVGDALMNLVYPSKSMLYGNQENMQKSAAKISAIKGATIHFGHGKSVPNQAW